MRILVINYEYPPIGGGGGDASKYISEGYAAQGHQVIVLTAHWDHLPHRETPRQNLTLMRIFALRKAADHATPFQMAAFMVLAFPRALLCALRFKPDVVHCHFAIPVGPIGLGVKAFTGIPYIVTFQGGDVPGFVPEQTGKYFRLIMPLARMVVHKASHAVASGEGLRKMAVQDFGRSDILHIPNGVDVDLFKPLENSGNTGPVRIVFAGRFNPQKALHRLIHAISLLIQKGLLDFRVDLIGGGPLEANLRSLIKDLKIESHVYFHGWMTREELSGHLGKADIFVLPSDVEGMPVACLQAMASGLAIIGSRIMGIQELVREGENGLLVEKGDIPALAEALESLIINRTILKKMGMRSREIAYTGFRWEVICNQYLELMHDIMEKL